MANVISVKINGLPCSGAENVARIIQNALSKANEHGQLANYDGVIIGLDNESDMPFIRENKGDVILKEYGQCTTSFISNKLKKYE